MSVAQLRQPVAHVGPTTQDCARRRPRCVAVSATEDQDSKASMDALDQRIASGQYSQSGSKKEKLTRPARKWLSKDRIGPGIAAELGGVVESLVQTAGVLCAHASVVAYAKLESSCVQMSIGLGVPDVCGRFFLFSPFGACAFCDRAACPLRSDEGVHASTE